MKVKVVIHEAEEGGYWAEVPAIPGCATQGDTFEELLKNLYEAIRDASLALRHRDRASQEQLLRVCARSSWMCRDRRDGQGGRAQPS